MAKLWITPRSVGYVWSPKKNKDDVVAMVAKVETQIRSDLMHEQFPLPESMKALYCSKEKARVFRIANKFGVWIDWPPISQLQYILQQSVDAIVNAANGKLAHTL
eukprot:TRINITY_DN10574_c0_g1_i1.p1 TRINITY_DN10574_c0_g1~~TRINITY_DN10574_c0_g1_i1.p1  ORF type:complete len:105 (+),score=17.91 TRINITY_DN10574_c0_g1_i1:288-602(+)